MKILLGLSAILLPLLSLAQSAIKPLDIGDTVPDLEITHLYNYPVSSIHLSRLRGKLVILDFWSTWCGSCIEAFPKMHHLQQRFGDTIQVMLVNAYGHDTPEKVQEFFKKYTVRTGIHITLPYSLLQTSLPVYFPFQFIPHYVWINAAGKVIATTSQTEATEQNISAALAGNTGALHEKKDMAGFSASLPLLVNNNGGNAAGYMYRTLFTRYIEGIGNNAGTDRTDSGLITRLYMLNYPPRMLLRTAWPSLLNVFNNKIIIESTNAAPFKAGAAEDSSLYINSFCYDITVPPSTITQVQQYMREDMQRFFGVTVVKETRKMMCLLLTQSNAAILHSRGGEASMDIDKFSLRKYLKNESFLQFINLLNTLPAMDSTPVIDETGIIGNIDIQLPDDLYSLSIVSLQALLEKNGIRAAIMQREIPVTVIKNQ